MEPARCGLLINLVVTPGDVQDRNVIAPLLEIARKRFPSLKKAIADGGYQGKPTADEVRQQAGIPLEIVKRSDTAKGFLVLPKRWIVERTYGWLGRCRRLAKELAISLIPISDPGHEVQPGDRTPADACWKWRAPEGIPTPQLTD